MSGVSDGVDGGGGAAGEAVVTVSMSSLVASAWAQAIEESPNPWDSTWGMGLFGEPRRTYRERLDRQPRNAHGDLIPRIVTVRRNLRALGKPQRAPRLPA